MFFKYIILSLGLFFALTSQKLSGQKINQEYVLKIRSTNEKINLDGQLNDGFWETAHVAGDFSNQKLE
jgi:hypothetical protein